MGQSGGFLGRRLQLLLKFGFLLMKNLFKPLATSVSIPLGLTLTASERVAAIQKKIYGSGTRTLIILNQEMNYIIRIAKSLEESGLLIKGASEIIKSK